MWEHDLAQERGRWQALVNAVMNLRLSKNAGNFLTSWGPLNSSGRTLLHGVSELLNYAHSLNTRINLKCTWRLRSYRTVNTIRLSYKCGCICFQVLAGVCLPHSAADILLHPRMPRPSGSLGCRAGRLSGYTVIQAYRAFIDKQLQKVVLHPGSCPSKMQFYSWLLKQDSWLQLRG